MGGKSWRDGLVNLCQEREGRPQNWAQVPTTYGKEWEWKKTFLQRSRSYGMRGGDFGAGEEQQRQWIQKPGSLF